MKFLNSIHNWDVFIFMRLRNAPPLIPLCKLSHVISKTGDGPLYVAFLFGIAWQHGIDNLLVIQVLSAFGIERSLYYILKNSLRRNRPQASIANFTSYIVPQDQFSFPSGHTSAAFLMATLSTQIWPTLSLLFYCWASCIGISRVLLGVHFPTDIIVGGLLGIAIANISLQMV